MPTSLGRAFEVRDRLCRDSIFLVVSAPKNESSVVRSSSESSNTGAGWSAFCSVGGFVSLGFGAVSLAPSVTVVFSAFCSFDCPGVATFRRCRTRPFGRISLTKKSVYLPFNQPNPRPHDMNALPLFQNARETFIILTDILRNPNLGLFEPLGVVGSRKLGCLGRNGSIFSRWLSAFRLDPFTRRLDDIVVHCWVAVDGG